MEVSTPEILIPGRSSSPTLVIRPTAEADRGELVVCALCLSSPGKYTCPRCNSPYCSLACYRGPRHQTCSEDFYKESVLQMLREEQAGARDKRQVEEMLLKLREQEVVGDDNVGLDGVGSLGEEEASLWNSLTPREKKEFHRLLQSGDIGALVPKWKPWWEVEDRTKMNKSVSITELPEVSVNRKKHESPAEPGICHKKPDGHSENVNLEDPVNENQGAARDPKLSSGTTRNSKGKDSTESSSVPGGHKEEHTADQLPENKENGPGIQEDNSEQSSALRGYPEADRQQRLSNVPPPLKSIPALCSLSRNPSPLIQYSLVNVVYGYAFSLLRHNGDICDDDMLLDFTETLLGVSSALTSVIVYHSTAHGLQSAVRAASDPLYGGYEGGACAAIEATAHILLGERNKEYTLAALADLTRVLGRACKLVAENDELRRATFNAKKKCLFLAAWVNENEERLPTLYKETLAEHRQHLQYINGMAEISQGLQKTWGGKRPPEKKSLIQEIDKNET
ncbi:zinc finger HIT-type containing 2 L homeolog [Xenopus laevis]|uniref:LOC495706 protein n=1 Tax=Xenopus laevis TaxID=8355 RepID=Q5U225_XENLA|nr:zinc finger HIT-type containing 2 L homeolog [Xenopus laevis]AAH86313.1 LOC495706 protein [Xenopus laevis]